MIPSLTFLTQFCDIMHITHSLFLDVMILLLIGIIIPALALELKRWALRIWAKRKRDRRRLRADAREHARLRKRFEKRFTKR